MPNLVDLLNKAPRPLLDPQKRMMLLWTPKAGCTFAVKWFFWQMNLLDAALFYHGWAHNYREQVYYESQGYKCAIQEFDNNYTIIKVVRNPYERTVSSYIHAVRTGYADIGLRTFYSEEKTSTNGLSFRDFVNFISTINLSNCDGHHAVQTHPLEREGLVSPTYVVRLEGATDGLALLETELGLPHSPLHSFRSSTHHSIRIENPHIASDTIFDSTTKEFPKHHTFYTPELATMVHKMYVEDFCRYDYSPDDWRPSS